MSHSDYLYNGIPFSKQKMTDEYFVQNFPARTITKTRLKDKVQSVKVLQKAGLYSLNEMVASTSSSTIMVWKWKKCMDPLCSLLFPIENEIISKKMMTSSNDAKILVTSPWLQTLLQGP